MALVTSGHEPVGRRRLTWPTPKVTTNRTSRHSITGDGHWSAPGLEEQAAELSRHPPAGGPVARGDQVAGGAGALARGSFQPRLEHAAAWAR